MSTLIKNGTRAPQSNRTSGSWPGPVSGHYDYLVHWLQSLGDPHLCSHESIGLTSCCRGAGVSTVAADLARAAAPLCERPVLLLDLSSPRSTHGRRFGVSGNLGLSNAMDNPSLAAQWVRTCTVPNLSLLAMDAADSADVDSADAGNADAGNQAELPVDRRQMSDLLTTLERAFGLIVVDLPTTESKQCCSTAGLLGGVLLVMEAERTRSDLAARAKLWLTHAHATVLGVILNKNPQHLPPWLASKF